MRIDASHDKMLEVGAWRQPVYTTKVLPKCSSFDYRETHKLVQVPVSLRSTIVRLIRNEVM